MLPSPEMPLLRDILPDKKITIPVSWLVAGIMMLLSLGVGYGGYRTAFDAQQTQLNEQKKTVETLRGDVNNLTYEMGRLRVAVDDLREAYDRKK